MRSRLLLFLSLWLLVATPALAQDRPGDMVTNRKLAAEAARAAAAEAAAKVRANHTGTQAIATVSGLQPALDAKAAVNDARFPVTAAVIPARAVEVWLAPGRNDGNPGSGRIEDPFDCSTAAKFDAVRAALPANVVAHLLPGVFTTAIPNFEVPNTSFVLRGSGMYQTILRVVGATRTTQGAMFAGGGKQANIEISDLTLDCGLDVLTAGGDFGTTNVSGVALEARHGLLRRVRVINWACATGESFPLSLACYAGTGAPTPADPGDLTIDGCRVEPALRQSFASNIGIIGDNATAKLTNNTVIGGGIAGGSALNAAGDLRGLIVTGNHVSGTQTGFHLDTASSSAGAKGFIIANNHFERLLGNGIALNSVHDIQVKNNRFSGVPDLNIGYFVAVDLRGDVRNCVFEGNWFEFRDLNNGVHLDGRAGTGAALTTNTGNTFRNNTFTNRYNGQFGVVSVFNLAANYFTGNRDENGAPLPDLPDSPLTGDGHLLTGITASQVAGAASLVGNNTWTGSNTFNSNFTARFPGSGGFDVVDDQWPNIYNQDGSYAYSGEDQVFIGIAYVLRDPSNLTRSVSLQTQTLTANRVQAFPDKPGTIALTSDVPTAGTGATNYAAGNDARIVNAAHRVATKPASATAAGSPGDYWLDTVNNKVVFYLGDGTTHKWAQDTLTTYVP